MKISNMLPKPSFIRARDPSIMFFNRPGISQMKHVKKNLNFNMETDGTDSEITEDEKYLNVYLRIKGDIRNSKIYNVDEDTLSCIKLEERLQKNYKFTKIFDSDVTQTEIFNHVVKPRVLSFINGRNFSLLTYGASGSGKTFTIIGTPEEPGLIPRTIDYLFKSIRNIEVESILKPLPNGDHIVIDSEVKKNLDNKKSYILKSTLSKPHNKRYQIIQDRLSFEPVAEIDNHSDVTVSLWISFFEIYNEAIYDLLVPPVQRGKLRDKLELGKNKDNTYVKNLTFINVCDGAEAYQILQYGLENLNYGVTAVNKHSSRSHCIFTIKMLQSSKNNGEFIINNFIFCDLAGSERSKKTLNTGDRLKESVNINSSLLVLSRCIENIRKQQHVKDNRLIPFRDSKLTQFFQKALMGYEKIQMIVNINSSNSVYEETIHTLNFSAIAKSVLIQEEPVHKIRMKKEESISDTKTSLDEKEELINNLMNEINRKSKIIAETNTRYDELYKDYSDLIDETNEFRARFDNLLKEEKDRVTQLYRSLLDKRKKTHDEEIKRLRQDYKQKMKIEPEIICISSSEDSDDELNSNTEVLKKLQIKNREYKTRYNEIEKKLEDTKIQLEDTKQQLEEIKRQIRLKIKNQALQEDQIKNQTFSTEISFSHLFEEQCSDIKENKEEIAQDFKALVGTSESTPNLLSDEEIDKSTSDFKALYEEVKTELSSEKSEKESQASSTEISFSHIFEEQCSDIMENKEEIAEDFKALVDTSGSNLNSLSDEEIDESKSDFKALYEEVKTKLSYEQSEKERYRKSYEGAYRNLLEITEGTSDISFIYNTN